MRHAGIATVSVVLLFSVCLILASEIPTSNATDRLPSVSELELLNFTPSAPGSVQTLPYSELTRLRALVLAYDAGALAVSKYHDPVTTRGISGIAIFKMVSPAVVVVVVGSVKNNDFDPEGMGTGAIVDPRGFVLTNWHVIKGHSEAVVFLKPTKGSELDNAEVCVARVIYQDPTIDLALLKMIDPPSALHPISVGDIDRAQIAEDIHVIGHPNGNLWSYSTGVISQIRNDYKWIYKDGSKHEAKVLQLQTAINPGNSGGPVVDDKGQILGLVAMSEEGQNLNYAIAADVIKHFLFTGMQVTSRGFTKVKTDSKDPQRLSVAVLAGSTPVSKAVYADMVLYSINGQNPGLIATFSDGTEVKAWDSDSGGSFSAWSVKLPNGRRFLVATSNGTVSRISRIP